MMSDDRICDLKSTGECVCANAATRNRCPHFHFPCPGSISQRSSKRGDLKEAGEWSILNNRPFSEQPKKGDYTPGQIRRGASRDALMFEKGARKRALTEKRMAEATEAAAKRRAK